MNSFPYFISLLSVTTTSLAGSYFTSKSTGTDWYSCVKTSITPPNIVFPIAWTFLYVLLFFHLANHIQKKQQSLIFLMYLVLILHVLWCYVFFYLRQTISAFYIICILNIVNFIILYLLVTKKEYRDIGLFLPHVIWILFASVLNYLSSKKKC